MTKSINFFTENTKYSLRHKGILRKWINATVTNERKTTGDVNIILCDDASLLKLNKEYLKHDTLTDILTFPLMEEKNVIQGDIYISIERVRDNAKQYGQSVFVELLRVIIHGVLHLIGYNDESDEERFLMKKKEDYYLESWIVRETY